MTSKAIHRYVVRIEDVPRHSTLLALVTWLHDRVETDEQVVATALSLVKSGRVLLTGNFAGCPLTSASPKPPEGL